MVVAALGLGACAAPASQPRARVAAPSSSGPRAPAPRELDDAALDARAGLVATQLFAREHAALAERLDPGLRATLPTERLAALADGLERVLGRFVGVGAARGFEAGVDRGVAVACAFERGEAELRFAFGANGALRGLLVAGRPPAWSPPAAAGAVEELTIRDEGGSSVVHLVLTRPAGALGEPKAIVVDGRALASARYRASLPPTARELGHLLAARGIASLRVEVPPGVVEPVPLAAIAEVVVRTAGPLSTPPVLVLHGVAGALLATPGLPTSKVRSVALLAVPADGPVAHALRGRAALAARDGAIDPEERASIDALARRVAAIESGRDDGVPYAIAGRPLAELAIRRPGALAAEVRSFGRPALVVVAGLDASAPADEAARWMGSLAALSGSRLVALEAIDGALAAPPASQGDDTSIDAPSRVAPTIGALLDAWIRRDLD